MKINCKDCDNFQDDIPIKVVDFPAKTFLDTEIYHFEDGFKCTWNSIESLDIKDLQKGTCRCRGDD